MSMRAMVAVCGAAAGLCGCRPSDVLSVPPPAGVVGSGALQSPSGAESAFNGAKAQLFEGLAQARGLFEWSGVLTDEFLWSYFGMYGSPYANIDARMTIGTGGFFESGDKPLMVLLQARAAMLPVVVGLEKYESAGGRAKIGEAFALTGYVELFMAEGYCAGIPADEVVPGGGVRYGASLTTDSLLAVAATHFDSALANADGSDTVRALASIGLGRTLLNRGRYAAAAAAVNGVPTAFVYNTELPPTASQNILPNLYTSDLPTNNGGEFTMADREGGNGLNFVSAGDPRLVVDSTLGPAFDGSTLRFPAKFEANATTVPMATGVEARLIEAEAALQAGNANGWASTLNTLRADTADTHVGGLQALQADSTTGATGAMQVDVMFRERAFWLFGTGSRLGDLRRLIRQYSRDQGIVFPTGPYSKGGSPSLPRPLPNYGADVSLTLPTAANGSASATINPSVKGCLTSTKTA